MEREITVFELDEEVRVLLEVHPQPQTFEESNRMVTELEVSYPGDEFTSLTFWSSEEWDLCIGAFSKEAERRGTGSFSRRPGSDTLTTNDNGPQRRDANPIEMQRVFNALSVAIAFVQDPEYQV